jgi:hypothetical protein
MIQSIRTARLAAAIALGALLLAPPRAAAGTYRVAVCHPGFGAGRAEASFGGTSLDFTQAAACKRGGDGLQVRHRRSHTLRGRWGGWSIAAPTGATLVALVARASAARAGGIAPELIAGARTFAKPLGAPHRVAWRGHASTVSVRQRCLRAPSCPPADRAFVSVNRVRLRLRDEAKPTLGLGGPLVSRGAHRGTAVLDPRAGDLGAGVRRISVSVNGKPVGERTFDCALARGVGLRVQPCLPSAAATFAANTAAQPFRQGRNSLRVCAFDLATAGSPNAACAHRRVRIDNLCPVSRVAGGARLAARIAGASRKHGPRLAGALTGADGRPVARARVCVTSRVRGRAERLVATPTTDRRGRFRVQLHRGPTRAIRLAYWGGPDRPLERFLRLRVPARPRLALRPRGTLRNGQRLRFRVALPGPANARRLVKVQARAGRRWVPVSTGRTSRHGFYRAAYRFHATTGTRTYRFRALVPAQRGYPYAAGASRTKRKTVTG